LRKVSSPNPTFKNFYTNIRTKFCADLKKICTVLHIYIRIKFFERGLGKTFFQKSFPHKIHDLNLFRCFHADQVECGAENRLCCLRQADAELTLRFFFCGDDRAVAVEAVERRAYVDDVAGDRGRFVFFDRVCNDFREAGQGLQESRFAFACQLALAFSDRAGCLFEDTARSRVSILRVGTGASFKAECLFEREVDILDTVIVEIVEYNRADTDRFRNFFAVFEIGALFAHDFADLFDGQTEQVTEKNHVAGTGCEFCAVDGHGTVRNVNQLVAPVVAHQFHNLEPLCKVKALCGGGDIDALVEIIGILTINGSGDVTGGIQGGAVLLEDKARRHIVVRQIDDGCAFVQLQKTGFAELFDLSGHFVGIEGLTLEGIEGYAEKVAGLLAFFKGNIYKPLPESEVFFVAFFELMEFGSRFVLECVVVFAFVVVADVQLYEFVNAALFDGFAVAPLLVCGDLLAELGTPVAEVVDADAVITHKLVEQLEGVTDDGGTEMTDVERFHQVRGAVVENDRLPCTDVVGTVGFALFFDFAENMAGEVAVRNLEIQIAADCLRRTGFKIRRFFRKGRCNFRGSHTHELRETETRERYVAHRSIRRIFEHGHDVFHGESGVGNKCADSFTDFFRGDIFEILHICSE